MEFDAREAPSGNESILQMAEKLHVLFQPHILIFQALCYIVRNLYSCFFALS